MVSLRGRGEVNERWFPMTHVCVWNMCVYEICVFNAIWFELFNIGLKNRNDFLFAPTESQFLFYIPELLDLKWPIVSNNKHYNQDYTLPLSQIKH